MNRQSEWSMQQFMKGASILTLAAFIVKILSAIYRVPFQNMVGDAGFYTYQQVYPLLGIFVIWTSFGFAVALSKQLADQTTLQAKREVYTSAVLLLGIISIALFIVLQSSAPLIASIMGDTQLTSLIRATSWMALCMAPIATMKGAAQAEGRLMPVAISNIMEQAVRVTIVIGGAYFVMRSSADIYKASHVAIYGSIAGGLVAVVILWIKKEPRKWLYSSQWKRHWKELFILSVSFSASSLILLFYQLIDSITIFKILVKSMPMQQAMELKGVYDRGQPFVQLGILVATTLSLAIVPLIAHYEMAKTEEKAKQFTTLTFRIAFIFGLAATVGLLLVLKPLNIMLFRHNEQWEALAFFLTQIFLLSLVLPLTAILQGKGKTAFPIVVFGGSVLLKYGLNIWFIPHYQVVGAALSSFITLCLVTLLMMVYFKRIVQERMATRRFYRISLVSTLAMVAIVYPYLYMIPWEDVIGTSRFAATFLTITSAIIGAFVFSICMMRRPIIQIREWYVLPFGRQIAKWQLYVQKEEKK